MNNVLSDKYEPVIGLEVHIQLRTLSKIFCSDSTQFGATPNSQVSPISLGHPGTLPCFNKEVLDYAIRLGIACKSTITNSTMFARKNYFYADLPKGYQISQHSTPICKSGYITIKTESGKKQVSLTRIHIEEDTGKSMHDQDPYFSLIDLNRAGIPLLEMVTEPVISSSDEAFQYLMELRRLVRYLEICDGNMEEGSLRCDANVSLRLKGEKVFGSKVEIKNMNSIKNVQSAIEYEIVRQARELESGNKLHQETRSFDALKGTTFSMRSKETSEDYRYFPEPDLPIVYVTEDIINKIKVTLPPLPDELYEKYTTKFSLSGYDATVILEDKKIADYFERLTEKTQNYKAAANWMNGEIKAWLNDNGLTIDKFPLKEAQVAEIIKLIDSGTVSHSVASKQIFPELIKHPSKEAASVAQEKNLLMESDYTILKKFIEVVLQKYPDKVNEYKRGKTSLLGLFMGDVMRMSKGKADPKIATKLLQEELNKKDE